MIANNSNENTNKSVQNSVKIVLGHCRFASLMSKNSANSYTKKSANSKSFFVYLFWQIRPKVFLEH